MSALDRNTLREERGSAAMLAVVGMSILLVISVSFVSLGQLETKIGVNHAQETRAIQAAEAGARRVFREMANGSETAQEWLNKTQPIHNAVAVGGGSGATYTVSVVDNSGTSTGPDGDNIVVIRSQGNAGGGQSTVALFVQPSAPFAPTDAVRVNGYLQIKKTPQILGNCGSVHVTDVPADGSADIDTISGPAYIQQGVSTSGTSGSTSLYCKIAPGCSSGQQVAPEQSVTARPVPAIDPKKYAKYADYFLNDNGYAYQWTSSAIDLGSNWCSTVPCGDPTGWTKLIPVGFTPGTCVLGWQRNKAPSSTLLGEWAACGAASGWGGTPGTFYLNGDAKIGNTASSNPYKVTVIAEGSIEFTSYNGMHWDDLTTTSSPASINPLVPRDVLLVAGADLSIPGGTSYALEGGMLVHGQISFTGSSRITGFVLSENANPVVGARGSNVSNVTQNLISDTGLQLTYNCGMQPAGLAGPGAVLRWSAL